MFVVGEDDENRPGQGQDAVSGVSAQLSVWGRGVLVVTLPKDLQ